jgi:RimJ/RimL family protein N-acetyltransferase
VGEKYWNMGIATLALTKMIHYTFENFPVVRIFAQVFEDNLSSVKVLEKCGFMREALLKKSVVKNNQLRDCYIYALLASSIV